MLAFLRSPGCGAALGRRTLQLAPRLCAPRLASFTPRPSAIGVAARLQCSAAAAATAAAATSAASSSATAAGTAATLAEPVASRAVGWWLVGTAGSVFGMVVLGGVTRLTRSGLSMVEWRPQGSMLPQTEEAWEVEFEKYKQFPEYQRLYAGSGMMGLDDFKRIYWYEWAHRMAGRSIGLVFGLPLLGFGLAGMIPSSLAPRLGLIFALGGAQGLVGWWMVKSGLAEPPKDLDGVPRVSPYRLATHLTCAFAIYSLLLYTGLGVLQPRAARPLAGTPAALMLGRLHPLAALVGVTAISGAFVAGMQAGLAFNTFPLMDGQLIPEGYFELQPAYRNFFESVPSVQLHHRALALSTLGAVTAVWASSRRHALPRQLRLATDALLLAACAQVTLGISALLEAVPVWLGSAHQAGALTLFSVTLFALHSCRVPHAAAARLADAGARAAAGARAKGAAVR